MSTFSSLETVRRALFASQSAIQTTGHNISNANTEGYSRERVNLTPSEPYPGVGFNRPQIPGQLGTGVKADTVQRVRDAFVDTQVRQQATQTGYWQSKSDVISQMEDIMNEPTDDGLSSAMNDFWNSLQDLANNPTNTGARSVVRQRAVTLSDTFHYLSNSLQNIQDNTKSEIDVTTKQINSIADQINAINKQIAKIEPNGLTTNDLYDQRDVLVDHLSQLANVQVTKNPSGGNAPATAEGTYTVSITGKSASGQPVTFTLVDGKDFKTNTFDVDVSGTTPKFSVGGQALQSVSGKMEGLAESYTQELPNMQNVLDQMAYQLVTNINDVHKQGYGLTQEDGSVPSNKTFFGWTNPDTGQAATTAPSATNTQGAAKMIDISQAIKESIDNIAAAGDNGSGKTLGDGNNTNVNALAQLMTDGKMTFTLASGTSTETMNTTFEGFYQNAIGQMGVDGNTANLMQSNSETLQQTAADRRQSISGVSVDEEMTNLIQYQHAYNASAKMISVIDEMLNTIVNSLRR